MQNFKKYRKLYKIFISQYMKTLMQSKVDFIVGLCGFILSQMANITFIYLIFKQIPTLRSWSYEQILFIYGFALIPRGIDHLLADNIWMVALRMIVTGDFDKYMLRPMNLFFQVICEKFQPDALGELFTGLILIGLTVNKGIVSIHIISIVIFLLSIIVGTIIYTSVKLFFASTAFWFKESGPILQTAYDTADFAKYPIEIYAKPIQFIITWVLPFSFVAYLPSTYFLIGADFIHTIGAECVIAFITWKIAYWFFKKGTSVYESAGN